MFNAEDRVTAVIAHLVKPGRADGYEEWMKGIIPVARAFPGHLGVNILRPQPGGSLEYIIVLHFDRYDNLQNWLSSDVRREWIDRVKPLIQTLDNVQVLAGLETWFELPKRVQMMPPKRYKMALLTWFGVFVTLTSVGAILRPLFANLQPVLAQFLTIGIVVWILTYVLMPRLTQLFRKWLYPSL
jgi:uncharacterized protein